MNELVGEPLIDADELAGTVALRDGQVRCGLGKDPQVLAIDGRPSVLRRQDGCAPSEPHEMLDPERGPLIAVRLHVLTRKTLGGLETDLSARVLRPGGAPVARAVRRR